LPATPPSKPDRRISRIRLSSRRLQMDWLRHPFLDVRRERTSRVDPSTPLTRSRAVHCRSVGRGQRTFSSRRRESALRHYVGPFGKAPSRRPTPPSCVPSLHGRYPLPRYYGRSDPDRPVFRRPPWFPDSLPMNFRPFCLLPSAGPDQTRPLPLRWPHYFVRASPFPGWLADPTDRIEFTVGLHFRRPVVTDWSFTSSCSPPGGIAPMQLLSVTGPKVLARSGTFTLPFMSALRRTRKHRPGAFQSTQTRVGRGPPSFAQPGRPRYGML
jgi:hypothetical protein